MSKSSQNPVEDHSATWNTTNNSTHFNVSMPFGLTGTCVALAAFVLGVVVGLAVRS